MDHIVSEKRGHVFVLTINRPDTLNAINETLLLELEEKLKEASGQEDARVIILTGTGKSFASGGDIAAMESMTAENAKTFAQLGHRVFCGISQLPQPVIAAVNGYALGGGLELALACDLRIASSRAKMGLPETGLGLIPGFGGTQRLPRLIGRSRAFRLICTGQYVTAPEALELGIVDAVSEPEALLSDCVQLAERIARNSGKAIALAKKAMYEGLDLPMENALRVECDAFGEAFSLADHTEGIRAFLEKRPPRF